MCAMWFVRLSEADWRGPVKSFSNRLSKLLQSDDGPTATEYAVLLAVIALGVIGALSLFGVHMDNIYVALTATLSVF